MCRMTADAGRKTAPRIIRTAMLDKTFDAASVEPRIAKIWDDADAFAAGAGAKEGADPYTS
jgi:valyl-tRNA synthetase